MKKTVFPEPSLGYGSLASIAARLVPARKSRGLISLELSSYPSIAIYSDSDQSSGSSMLRTILNWGNRSEGIRLIAADRSGEIISIADKIERPSLDLSSIIAIGGKPEGLISFLEEAKAYIDDLSNMLQDAKLIYTSAKVYDLLIIPLSREDFTDVRIVRLLTAICGRWDLRVGIVLWLQDSVELPSEIFENLDWIAYLGPRSELMGRARFQLDMEEPSANRVRIGIGYDRSDGAQLQALCGLSYEPSESRAQFVAELNREREAYRDFLNGLDDGTGIE